MKLDVVKHGERLSNDYAKSRLLALYMKAKAIKLKFFYVGLGVVRPG